MFKKEKFPTELYNKHLEELHKQGKEVDIILDVTDEEANWLHQNNKKEKK